jgi:hypothetical protein
MLTGRKLALTLAFAVLVILAFGAGCHGFFVDPTLTSLSITPATPTITTQAPGNTQQFSAVGVFNDGSSGSTPVTWSSGTATVATINSSTGLATAVAVGTTTITVASTKLPSITATTQLTVVPSSVTSITVTPSNQSTTTTTGFTLTAKDQNGDDISGSVTWTFTVNGTTVTGITGSAGSGGGETFTIGTLNPSATPPYTLSITAKLTTSSGTVTSNSVTVLVTS